MAVPRPKDPAEYARELEDALARCLQPLRDIPFKVAIRALSGCAVLDFDSGSQAHRNLAGKIAAAARKAGDCAHAQGICTARPNEAGNAIEPLVREALREAGLPARTPQTRQGIAKAAGYPDIEIVASIPCYLECKTYNLRNVETTQRAFYFSPSRDFKVTRDALHLLLAYELRRETRGGRSVFIPVHWRLYTLQDLRVDLKHEFNQHNRNMYGNAAAKALIDEGEVG